MLKKLVDEGENGWVRMIKDVGPHKIWSTVLLAPERSPSPLGFSYAVGQQIPHHPQNEKATWIETNLRCAHQFVDESITVLTFDWCIPSLSPAAYQIDPSKGDYRVTEDDVRSFVDRAWIGFFCGGEKPYAELPARAEPVKWRPPEPTRDALGGWYQRIAKFEEGERFPGLVLGRIEKFWAEINWPHGMPKFGGVLPLVFVLGCRRSRGVN